MTSPLCDIEGEVVGGTHINTGRRTYRQGDELCMDTMIYLKADDDNVEMAINGARWDIEVTSEGNKE